MVVHTPSRVKEFCQVVRDSLSRPQFSNLTMLISGILLAAGKRSMAQFGRTIAGNCRYRGTISRHLRSAHLRSRDLCGRMCKHLVQTVPRRSGARWFLCIDGVSTRRGGFTKIANAQQFQAKGPNGRGAGSKSHTFVMGLLITETGVRIPLRRRTWRTRAYSRSIGKRYKKQTDLAAELIEETLALLPNDINLVVLADAFFGVREFADHCRRLKVTYIAPVGPHRTYTDVNRSGKRVKKKIVHCARRLRRDAWEEFSLVSGSEETVHYRRYSARERKKRNRRSFRVYNEIRTVTTLGDVNMAYSWKCPIHTSRGLRHRESLKLLASNDHQLTAREIVEFYEVRWQIELFFRELKSDLGLGDFRGTDFQAFERYVDLILLSFMCLEWSRLSEPRTLSGARSAGLRDYIRVKSVEDDFIQLASEIDTRSGRRRFTNLVQKTLHPSLRYAQ